MMSASDANPLVKALPPETDYLTYLTILEYNLTKEQLPLLHNLLQDTRLTANIGWDLVHLLLPLLPEAEQCLHDIACLGNPRETVLKVAELLEEIPQKGAVEDDDDSDDDGDDDDHEREGGESKVQTQLLTLEFQTLVHMLCVLHPRIKTKYPSRFLVTSMQAIICAYEAIAYSPAATATVMMFIKSTSGSRRPQLPPRLSEQMILTVSSSTSASDPEGQSEASSPEEEGLKVRLLRSFMTHLMEKYVQSLSNVRDSSSLTWTDRCFEKRYPARVVPHRTTYRELFKTYEELQARDSLTAQLLNTADGDLQMPWRDMVQWITLPMAELEHGGSMVSTTDFPLSRVGALYCIAAKASMHLLHDRNPTISISLFNDHDQTTKNFVELDGIGTQSASLIDAILLLGWAALVVNGGFEEPESNEVFYEHLQRLSLLSANTPFSSLRYQAHVLSSTILFAHISSKARLGYIRDTLEHCPYENLKVSAIGWLKDETLAAFATPTGNKIETTEFRAPYDGKDDANAFASPSSLKSVAPYLFAGPTTEDEEELALTFPYWLAVVNFYYLLCSSPVIYKGLEVAKLISGKDDDRTFFRKLKGIVQDSKDPTSTKFEMYRDNFPTEVGALEDGLNRIDEAISRLDMRSTTSEASK